MWRTCATLCLAAALVGQAFGDDSPGRTGERRHPEGYRIYVGVCDGKEVTSSSEFRDCEELKLRVVGAECLTGANSETLASIRDQGRIKIQAEQARIRVRPLIRVVRDALNPFLQNPGLKYLFQPTV